MKSAHKDPQASQQYCQNAFNLEPECAVLSTVPCLTFEHDRVHRQWKVNSQKGKEKRDGKEKKKNMNEYVGSEKS